MSKIMTVQELLIECDLLQGNINRMMVTDDPQELFSMYKWAERRIQKIYIERFNELDKHREEV